MKGKLFASCSFLNRWAMDLAPSFLGVKKKRETMKYIIFIVKGGKENAPVTWKWKYFLVLVLKILLRREGAFEIWSLEASAVLPII